MASCSEPLPHVHMHTSPERAARLAHTHAHRPGGSTRKPLLARTGMGGGLYLLFAVSREAFIFGVKQAVFTSFSTWRNRDRDRDRDRGETDTNQQEPTPRHEGNPTDSEVGCDTMQERTHFILERQGPSVLLADDALYLNDGLRGVKIAQSRRSRAQDGRQGAGGGGTSP